MIRDESGRIDGVRYDELAPMLLNEVQQQQRKIVAQDEQNAVQAAEIRDLTRGRSSSPFKKCSSVMYNGSLH